MSVGPVFTASTASAQSLTDKAEGSATGRSFGRLVDDFLSSTARAQSTVDQTMQNLALGKSADFHSVALTAAKADLNFRFVLEVRNRLIEAYQEVMRMQV